MMNYNINSFSKKPIENEPTKQLFSYDVSMLGAKNFLFNTYEHIYTIIKSRPTSYFYEDNTFSTGIKLFIDFDDKIIFNTELERDKYAEKITDAILLQINTKLYNVFRIKNPSTIILMSDTLLKLSLHFVYPDIVFNNIYEIKYFMNDIKLIDQSVYKIGCFRMLYCSKLGKNNKLFFSDSINYIKPKTDYELFLDACICYTNNKTKINIKIPTIIKTSNNKIMNIQKNIKVNNKQIERNFVYRNIDFTIIKTTLDKLKSYSTNYTEWLIIGFCLKDLYLGSTKEEQETIYNLFDEFSKSSDKYNSIENKTIFLNLEPKIDINYLFKMIGEPYYILPFYNYQEIIFNSNNHTNIITKNEKYIDVDIDLLLAYKYIFIKSPTGTGKTTFLKKIINNCNINNIISITSRVNLAGEHTKQLDLKFYLDLKMNDYNLCNRLVIQLESLKKCNYKLFKNGIVILDEVNSLLSHLRSPTMNNKRKDTYLYLIELIKNAKYIISLDADLSDWNIKFLQEIKKTKYIVYYNTNKNKLGTDTILYKCPNIMIEQMEKQIKEKQYFISCFDSLKQMNKIIEHLSQFGNKEEWLIYSSEVNYDLIDTKLWTDKFIFFTPSIIYGIDYNHKSVDVFSFVYKNHLNPLQIYQMISRARQQNKVHIYCNERESYVKYKNIEDIIHETELYEKNFGVLLPLYNNYIDIDDKPYRTMYYNFRFMDAILKTNIKGYLIDILIEKGYNISHNEIYKKSENNILNKTETLQKKLKEKIVNLLYLDKNNLTDFEKSIVSDDKVLDKHFNLRLLLKNNINDKLIESITENLFIETIKCKYTKIKICREIMTLLEIDDLQSLNKDLTKKFKNIINNEWLKENLDVIKKTFEIRTNKYCDFTYYNIYLLLITILKNLFDINLFTKKEIQMNKVKHIYHILDKNILLEHTSIIKKFNDSHLFNEFI
jgi:hypothetical protein